MAMVLVPNQKLAYFKNYWPEVLQDGLKEEIESVFQDYFCSARSTRDLSSSNSNTKKISELSYTPQQQ
ncbi:hypothetical protein CONPUDRAFT_150124 [Coniophora puteana RWD-64-598 SS2]|uniref:Uncharacterized protein n=1 Tax=Coniophora puteana (strain RWD-64-598) TaxID=741705 RepID=A0A5M3N1P0_CONPW|nr:uncharacterized protein CONPUDRAFT_150124 [Coniophora puteana RWD-64-598 SS2]EIW85303.1 hypothetical protein CONPUDRAFT_150124 [Coniophora puteana RWD-64-598 SS2]